MGLYCYDTSNRLLILPPYNGQRSTYLGDRGLCCHPTCRLTSASTRRDSIWSWQVGASYLFVFPTLPISADAMNWISTTYFHITPKHHH
eukprot:scaffold4833_cov233-Amphora_coffeaeformis.AAC.21